MAPNPVGAAVVLVLGFGATLAASKGFLVGKSRASLNSDEFQSEISNAMSEALGCGGHIGEGELAEIEQALVSIWKSLPKTSSGRIERRSLRYLVYRYFYQRSALLIRGFEPTRSINQSDWGSADILSQKVPSFVESALESQHAMENGFDLQDAVKMVATLEELIFDSESTLLERVYRDQHKPTSRSLSYAGLGQVLESYMLHWLLAGDEETTQALLKDETLREQTIPHWDQVVSFAKGQISAIQFQRTHNAKDTARPDHNALAPRYSFEDAHRIVGAITRSFASFWESECRMMTASLIEMDAHNTGRVPLSRFYSGALSEDWRFGESESYLRELGALDETSNWRGKQVIIPNYVQAASNCIVSTPHYRVCCMSYCDSIFSDIESRFAAPTALTIEILHLVGNMTTQVTIDQEDTPRLDGALTTQLEQIAAAHGGKVPLHGRLFAQWLHYVFPRVCPFPQKAGTVATAVPHEYGEKALATDEEMNALSQTVNEDIERMSRDQEWMSQWSTEEELIADYAGDLRPPWASSHLYVASVVLFAACCLLGIIGASLKTGGSSADGGAGLLPAHGKSHFV